MAVDKTGFESARVKAIETDVKAKIQNANLSANENHTFSLTAGHAYILIVSHPYQDFYGEYMVAGGFNTGHVQTVHAYANLTVEKLTVNGLKVSTGATPAFVTLIG